MGLRKSLERQTPVLFRKHRRRDAVMRGREVLNSGNRGLNSKRKTIDG
jgi:hypothetical protein